MNRYAGSSLERPRLSLYSVLPVSRNLFAGTFLLRPILLSLLLVLPMSLSAADTDRPSLEAADLLVRVRAQTSLKLVRELTRNIDATTASREKGQILAYLASLEFLAGNHERSARLWLDAHSLTADDSFLLDAVRALILIGEGPAARAQLDRLLSRGRDPHSLREARFLAAQLAIVEGRPDEAILPDDLPQSLPHRMASFRYMELWHSGLAAETFPREFSGSPESHLVSGSPLVSLFPHPLWFLGRYLAKVPE